MSQQQYDRTENDLKWLDHDLKALDDSLRLERVYDFDRIIMQGGVHDF